MAEIYTEEMREPSYKGILQSFIIENNNFLKYDTEAFFHCYYTGFRNPDNPDFLNTLKNNKGDVKIDSLFEAMKQLFNVLMQGLPFLIFELSLMSENEICVCIVPRSKANFTKDKMFFRATINEFINYFNFHLAPSNYDYKSSFFAIEEPNEKISECIMYCDEIENGIEYIVRHTNTKTTHLTHSEKARMAFPNNDGDMPYVGITKNTCHISEKVKGKTILLIDDIYTKSMNIDEDCIQALYDFGAKKVFLYTVAYTKDKFSSPSSANIDDKIKEIFSRYKI